MYLQDGYKLIRADHLLAGLHALNERQITFRAFRAFIASFELAAIRDAAKRQRGAGRVGFKPRYLQSELAAMIDENAASVSRELKSLKRAALLHFTEAEIIPPEVESANPELCGLLGGRGAKRLVPVPRQVLKYVARSTRPAIAKTILGYLLRGLSLDRDGKLRGVGTVKISWICRLCRISERAARAARAELVRIGWITKDTGSVQRKLNRDGAYFIVNLCWRRSARKEPAPLLAEKCTRSAPPIERQETPYGSKNQKPARAGAGLLKEKLPEPTLRDIRPEDLRTPLRLEKLYRQAVTANWIQHSEANVRNFASAALRATRAGGRVGAVFTTIVQKQLWHHITHDQEDRAAEVLKRFGENHGRNFGSTGQSASNASGSSLAAIIATSIRRSETVMRPVEQGPAEHSDRLRMLAAQVRQQLGKAPQTGLPPGDGAVCTR